MQTMTATTPLATGEFEGLGWEVVRATMPHDPKLGDDGMLVVRTADGGDPWVSAVTDSPFHAAVWAAATRVPAVTAALEAAVRDHDGRLAKLWGLTLEQVQAKRAANAAARRARAERLAELERTGRRCMVRFGRLPAGGHSYNRLDDRDEAGVSVYDAWCLPGRRYVLDLRTVDAVSAVFIAAGRPMFRVSGGTRLTATGSDGEPLVADPTVYRVKPADIQMFV